MKRLFFLLLTSLFFSLGLFSEEKIDLAISQEDLQKRLSEFVHYNPDGSNPIGYLSIGKDRAIDQSTYIYIKFAIDYFKEQKTPFIVLDLNTPGGEVFAALKIAELLQQVDINDHIPVIAFIDNWAISAGAMLAYSCRFIGITKSSSMGAAEPVMVGQEGKMESASEKINSALRAEFSNLASFYGRNPLLAEAMVDKDLLIVYRKGEIIKLDDEKELILEGAHPDIVISKKGKLLTLNSEQLIDYGVADFMVAPKAVAPVTEMEKSEGKWPASKCLMFQESYFASIPQATLLSYQDWRIDFFAFLSHPMISSLLFMGLILGVYMELNHPGFGVPAFLAITCLVLILLSSFAIQAVNWIEVIMLLTGIILLFLEIFVLPTFGVAGVLGVILTLVGLFALMMPQFKHVSFDPSSMTLSAMAILDQLAYLCAALIVSLFVIVILWKFFSYRLGLFNRFVLKGEQEGYVSGPTGEMLPKVGAEGKAFTPLRPSGKILIEDKLYDAITEGGFVEKDSPIKVARIEGSKVIVQLNEK